MIVYWSELQKDNAGNATKKKRLTRGEIKQQLHSSLLENKKIETANLS